MHFTRKSSEQKMTFVYNIFLTVVKMFPSVVGRDGYQGNALRAVGFYTHLNISTVGVPVSFYKSEYIVTC
jgi:hypothetical protein